MARRTIVILEISAYRKLQPKIENIFVYFKSEKLDFNLTRNGIKEYPEKDKNGNFRYVTVEQMDAGGVRGRETMVFPIKEIMPRKGKQWQLGKEKIDMYENRNDVLLINNKPHIKIREDDERAEKTDPFWGFFTKKIGTAESAKKEVSKIMGGHGFETIKPIKLIQKLIFHATSKSDTVFDFFAGTGTTADAVMQLNAEDDGNRKFILAQIDEKIDKKKKSSKAAYEFCTKNKFEPVISSICIERVNRAGEKIKKELDDKKDLLTNPKAVDIGYKVFSLTEKPKINYDEDQKEFNLQNRRKSSLDTLYNMMTLTGKELHQKVKIIKKDSIYEVGGEVYILGNITDKDIEKYKDIKINIDAFVDINLEDYLNLGITNKENITIVF